MKRYRYGAVVAPRIGMRDMGYGMRHMGMGMPRHMGMGMPRHMGMQRMMHRPQMNHAGPRMQMRRMPGMVHPK
jgi:hypothetical protein